MELYQAQQQLAKLQMSLEKAHERHEAIVTTRSAAEAALSTERASHDRRLDTLKSLERTHGKHQSEVETQQSGLKQLEAASVQLASELTVTKNVTHKAYTHFPHMSHPILPIYQQRIFSKGGD